MPDDIEEPPPEDEGEIELDDLAAFVGRPLLDLNTNFFGIVRTRTDRRTGRVVYWLSDPNSGRAQDLRTGATLVDPTTRSVTNVSASTTGSAADSTVSSGGKLSEADLRRLFGEEEDGGGGSGGSAPSFASTQAAQTQDEAFRQAQARRDAEIAAQAATLLSQRRAEQDRLDREATAEQGRLAEEGALQRNRLGVLSNLISDFVGAQSQARDTLANLQPNPFRFAAVAGGITPFGTTPQQGFQEQLQQFAGASVPQFDPSGSAASLEPIIAQLTGAQAPQAPQIFGAADGATIPAPLPGQSVAVKVGEKGEEILRITSQGVEVIPIAAGAQDGGFFPFEPIEFDAESLLPALGTSGIFGSLGIQNIPRGRPGLAGGLGAGQRGVPFSRRGIGVLESMGIQPGLIRFGDSTSVFFRNPEGQLERFRDTGAFLNAGFDRSQVVRFAEGTQDRFDFAAPFRGRPDIPTAAPSPFTKFSQPIVEPTTGTLLPAPFTVARQMNRLRLTNPFMFNLLLSAYDAAGVPGEAVIGSIQTALPFGAERGAIGLN